MEWVTCPQCGFTQIPTGKCLRCGRALSAPDPSAPPAPASRDPAQTRALDAIPPPPAQDSVAATIPYSAPPAPAAGTAPSRSPSLSPASRPPRPRPPSPPPAVPAPPPPRSSRGTALAIAALSALVIAIAVIVVRGRGGAQDAKVSPTPAAASPSAALDLSGRWEVGLSKNLFNPSRPALKQAFLETDREGAILAAGVVLTDPGRGGAGAGYRVVTDGPQRLGQVSSALAASPGGVSLPQLDFIPFPAWMPSRERSWRVLEGQSRRILDVRYVLLESIEDDYLVQAGINRSGFLSYAFFSKEYTHNRGLDALSSIIHPDTGSDLRGFKNLVWDFSGAADFLTLEVHATDSGPEGGTPDRLTLKRPAR